MIGSGVGFAPSIGGGIAISFGTELFNPPTPVNIPAVLSEGTRIRLVLIPTGSRFHVNFKAGNDIALHFNPRFDESALVFNSTKGGSWQAEERHPQPLQEGRVFTVEFVPEDGILKVLINGVPTIDFVERIPSHEVSQIEVGGDVHVHSAHVTH